MQALETSSEYHKVTLVRTPGRHGIPRNEEADKLAKEGTNEVLSLAKLLVPLCCGLISHQESFQTGESEQVENL